MNSRSRVLVFSLLSLVAVSCATQRPVVVTRTAPSPPPGTRQKVTVLRSSTYDITPWAVTDILPGGRNAPFTGVGVPEMMGADSVDTILEEFEIPALGVPVKVPMQLVLLNERNIEPLDVDGKLFDFFYTLNPKKKSLATMTVVQTKPDDHGPAPEGIFTRETTIELLATMRPLDGGEDTVIEATVFISTPLPIPFSFDPAPGLVLKTGPTGDHTANAHTNKTPSQKDFYGLGGMLQVPLGGRSQFDASYAHSARGGSVKAMTGTLRDVAPSVEEAFRGRVDVNARVARVTERLRLAGVPVADANRNGVFDYYESDLTGADSRASLIYDAGTGQISVEAAPGVTLTAVRVSSASGILTGDAPENLGGALDTRSEVSLLKTTFDTPFRSVSFGRIAKAGLSREFVEKDLTARAAPVTGPTFGGLKLVYRK